MKLDQVIKNIQVTNLIGHSDIDLKGINSDSRKVESGHLFVAVKGTQTDGHSYISTAIEKGAIAVLCEELPTELSENVTYIQVKDTEDAVGKAVHHHEPVNSITVSGVSARALTYYWYTLLKKYPDGIHCYLGSIQILIEVLFWK